MAAPIVLPPRTPSPVAPLPVGYGLDPAVRRARARNRVVARHIGTRRSRLSSPLVAGAALAAALLVATRFLLVPTMAAGLLTVTLTGLAAWRCAIATAHRSAASDRPKAANDNPPRPRLPPHALPC